ncbi:hypothetical protein CAPN006_12380 [Capnocytophaga canimorsus]|uniref:peptidase n=1 Tax=Capnocytophaga canimorsus TaxID=28188 RepID=UPI001AC9E1BA|nr:peptidase [Capnocytophaga canimorsus]GIM56845.1 hypothetical protein CAPN006_12380 [Capnocytophaga canimorsus]
MIATFTLHATGQKVSAELKEIEKEFLIYFELPENYDYNFGFDSFRMSKKGAEDKEKLKNEYRKYTIADKEYLAPWVSIRQGQTITLTMKIKKKRNFKTQRIELSHSDFTFSPDKITPETFAKSKKVPIQITCKTTFAQDQVVELKTENGEMVGAIAFIENTVKKLKFPVNWYKVEFGKNDLGAINRLVRKIDIEEYFKKAFTPALIEVDVNEVAMPINISKAEKVRIVNKEKNNVINRVLLGILLCYAVKRNRYQLSLFTTFIKSEKQEDEMVSYNNGLTMEAAVVQQKGTQEISKFINDIVTTALSKQKTDIDHSLPQDESFCIMFLANEPDKLQPSVEIPHEIMHALGLEHTFAEDTKKDQNKKHIFNKGGTRNYMDYQNTKKHTQKWQWEIMRSSKYLKTLILVMCLFLMSCKTMSYKQIQTISCACNDTILQADKKLPIPPPERIKNDSLDISVSNWYREKGNEGYLKYIDNLKTNERKMIYYDLGGNIKESLLSIPYEFIGRKFSFDESGNIKEIINHDEGWNICAFQALAIAKKRAGNNYYKEDVLDPLWQIRKTKLKDKDIWVVHYSNKKYKTISLYIDRNTGKIVKRVKH